MATSFQASGTPWVKASPFWSMPARSDGEVRLELLPEVVLRDVLGGGHEMPERGSSA